ncbi:MAG: ATP-binding cassette domain-containing protein [Acidimicrobiia bacterium]|nr:ATP-binding cassette domain-containing protein [Acidimicrobiia bacterium]
MLELRDLTKRYNTVQALAGCTFTVQPGRMLGFVGPNGAGKTTTMRCVFGLVKPDSGSVSWKSQPIGMADLLTFGYMPEQRGLYPKMRIADQVSYFGELHGQSRSEARAATISWLERLGLGERLSDRLEQLSHGNQQRVQLATALVHNPSLLVLDEPFAGLDPLAADVMSDVLRERAAAGVAVVFSSHQLDLVEDLCEDVAVINAGKIVLTGELSELKRASGVRRLEVFAPGADDAWTDSLPGVISVERNHQGVVVLVEAGIDPATVFAAIDAPVESFSFSPPSLTDLYREAVQ